MRSRLDLRCFYLYIFIMARPKKEAGTARDKLMQVRVKPQEYESFREATDVSGLDLSAWVRQQLLLAIRKGARKYA
jgi:hypothetical protein